ncbi:tyrosine-type recombinase/integrase [Massilia sp. TS11]|uniref:tyrosine-type recombinase/integrase n=1 Tax=Massilia sp. TS11 TaxID=2908003 RepID=UPI0035A3A8E7
MAGARNTFEAVAQKWLQMKRKEWSDGHYSRSARAIERNVVPALGKLPVANITPAMIATTMLAINKRDVFERTSRILQHVNGVFRNAQARGLCRDNRAGPVRKILPRKKESGRMAALLNFDAHRDVLRRAQLARLSPAAHFAHRLSVMNWLMARARAFRWTSSRSQNGIWRS